MGSGQKLARALWEPKLEFIGATTLTLSLSLVFLLSFIFISLERLPQEFRIADGKHGGARRSGRHYTAADSLSSWNRWVSCLVGQTKE